MYHHRTHRAVCILLALLLLCTLTPVPFAAAQEPEPGIYVPQLTDAGREGFIRGTDVSSYLSLVRSGAVFYDFEGNALTGQGFFDLLAACGFNYIRLRVWNDPYDADGNGYGGGNCDLDAALQMGTWATAAGLRVLIDFHYSDFWADPGKQRTPKAWEGDSLQVKQEKLAAYTYDSLKTLFEAGVDVGMVQIGNETNGSFCGESSWASMAQLFSAGSAAARQIAAEQGRSILVALHFTNPETSGRQLGYAKTLNDYGVDYDVFATSWYPYWHGTTTNLTAVLKSIADTYGKQVMIAETSWAWSLDDGDGWSNTVSRYGNNTGNDYPFSVQGQANELCAAASAVLNVGANGLGLFYWENAWIPVRYAYDVNGELNEDVLAANRQKWEAYGSGWASSYAGGYDADAGTWYGGSAVDNQAMFDFNGRPLESLKTFRYMLDGTAQTTGETVEAVDAPALTVECGGTLTMPATVTVQYGVAGSAEEPVDWDADALAAVDLQATGYYEIPGAVHTQLGDVPVTATVTVLAPNLLQNPGFEQSDLSMYQITNGDRSTDTPHSGSRCMHFWSSDARTFEVSQTLTLEPGDYTFSLFAQGDDKGGTEQYIYATAGGETWQQSFALAGWKNWQEPALTFTLTETCSVTVGVRVSYGAGGWGTVDDLSLRAPSPQAEPTPTVRGYSISLSGEIGVNLYLDLNGASPEETEMQFAWAEKTQRVPLTGLEPLNNGVYAGCYKLTARVSAKEMTDEIRATLTVGSAQHDCGVYSVQGYAARILQDPDAYGDTLVTLVRSMLVYGASAQRFFGYRTEDLAWTQSQTLTQVPELAMPIGTKPVLSPCGLELYGMSLLLESETALRLYFRVTDETLLAAAEIAGPDGALTVGRDGETGLAFVTVRDVSAKALRSDVTLTFNGAALTVNAGSYLALADRFGDPLLTETARALYAYAQAAAAYFS